MLCFIDCCRKPLDKGATELIKNGKIESYPYYDVNSINVQCHNNKNYYGVVINHKDSILKIQKVMENKIKIISIAERHMIDNVPWVDIISPLNNINEDMGIKIIICKGTLIYIPCLREKG